LFGFQGVLEAVSMGALYQDYVGLSRVKSKGSLPTS
jgi:hypothetical protein